MKLSPLTIFILGASLSFIFITYAVFQHFMPNRAEADNFEKYADSLRTEAEKMPRARQRVALATKMVNDIAGQWQQVVAAKTPLIGVRNGGIDLAVNRWQLTKDARDYRNNVQRAINRQLHVGGVKVITGPEVPMPSDSAQSVLEGYFNYPAISFPVAIFNLGTVTVRGTFDQISNHVKAWSFMPHYLAVADGLRLTGTSPNLTGTYNLSVVAFIRGDKIYPPVPEGTAAAGAGGGPTGGGGPINAPTAVGAGGVGRG